MFKKFLYALPILAVLSSSITYWIGLSSVQSSLFALLFTFIIFLLYIKSPDSFFPPFFLLAFFYFLISSVLCSLMTGNHLIPLRFLLLLTVLIIPSCFLRTSSSAFARKYFKHLPSCIVYASLPMAIFIIFLQFSFFLGTLEPEIFRQALFKSDSIVGTIYKHSYSPFYHIQISGFFTPFPAFILSLLLISRGFTRFILPAIVLLTAIIFSLNTVILFASFSSLFVFAYSNFKSIYRVIAIYSLILVIAFSFVFILDLLIAKFSSELSSTSLRSDMILQIFLASSSNPFSLFFGTGVGSTLEVVSRVRDYTGRVYFEFMTLYIFLQLGVIGFSCLLLPYVNFFHKLWRSDRTLIIYFLCFLMGSFFNPYFFNSLSPIYIICFISFLSDSDFYSPSRLAN